LTPDTIIDTSSASNGGGGSEQVIGAGPNAGLTPSQVEARDAANPPTFTSTMPDSRAKLPGETDAQYKSYIQNQNFKFAGGDSASASISSFSEPSSTSSAINRPVLTSAYKQNSLSGAGIGSGIDDFRTKEEKDAEDYLDGSFTKPKTEEEIIQERTNSAKGIITSLNDFYDQQLKEQGEVNKQREAETNAQSVLSGLMGSSEAGSRAIAATEKGAQANKGIQAERNMKLQEIYTNIQNNAKAEAKDQRNEARLNAQDILARSEQKRQKATEDIKILAGAGFELDTIRQKDPNTYASLVRSIGGEDKLKSLFVINRPKQDIVGTPVRVGNHYVQMYRNPLTGAVTAENIEIPGGLPANYTKFEKLQDANGNQTLIAIPDDWDGDPSKLKTVGGGNGGGGSTGGIKNPEYAATVNTILGSGKFTKDQVALVKNAINNGEDPMIVIKNQAKNILGTEGTALTKYEGAKNAMQTLEGALKEFYAANGNSGIFSGNFEKVYNKLGAVNDPKLVDIAVQIAASLQKYRNAISGTAYSEQEGKDIASIFPGINKGEILNSTIVKARMKTLDSDIDGLYRTALGGGYDKLKAFESGKTAAASVAPAPAGYVNIMKPDGSVGMIPEANLDQAIKLGAKKI
jgi:hypothetical protein